MIIRMIIL